VMLRQRLNQYLAREGASTPGHNVAAAASYSTIEEFCTEAGPASIVTRCEHVSAPTFSPWLQNLAVPSSHSMTSLELLSSQEIIHRLADFSFGTCASWSI